MKIQIWRKWSPFSLTGDAEKAGVGGLETQAIGLGRELAKRGHEVEFYTNCSKPGNYDGVEYKQIVAFKEPGDVVIGIMGLPNASLKKRGIWVTWVHILDYKNHFLPHADYVICNSKFTLAAFQRRQASNKYLMIPNGFDYKLFNEPKIAKIPNSIAYVGYAAKGMHRLPKIFNKVKQAIPLATCHVYGGARLWRQAEKRFQDTVDAVKQANVTYHGLVPKDILAEALKKTEIFLLPHSSLGETFGISIIEAMAAGCVPVCCAKENVPNLVTPDVGILLKNEPAVDEAEGLINLLKNREKLVKLSGNSRLAVKQYDWSNIMPMWEKEVLGKA